MGWIGNQWFGYDAPVPILGFATPGGRPSGGSAMPPSLAPTGQYYVYPDGNLSNAPGPGATGPFSQEEAQNRASAMKTGQTYTPGQSVLTPNIGAPPTADPIATSANAVANAAKPTVPNFITPYQRPSGVGAYGESDVLGKKLRL